MKILVASTEAVPFAKTGGLADVSAALPKALDRLGHDVSLILPWYPQKFPWERESALVVEPTGETIGVTVGTKRVSASLLRSQLPGTGVTVYLVDQPTYFNRAELYTEQGEDYRDNCERFVFFSRAVLEAARVLDLRPDAIHANDWQTGLIPALVEIEGRSSLFPDVGTVFTIHNIAFQGSFWHWDMLLTGLDWKFFNWKQMEFFSHLNLLKTGIVFAGVITTVSPTYAREIQTEEFGGGLHGVLAGRRENLVGILNGIDADVWNPATDPALPQNYTIENVVEGKGACKAHVQGRVGLPLKPDVPLFAMISRMADQKGFDLIAGCADEMLRLDAQFIFLGTGEAKYERLLSELSGKHPEKVATIVGFDEELAHQMEAAADIYLMPSRFEPCGLNQMYSLRYGTLPIVRAVGGLADSVVDATPENIASGTANGFRFDVYEPEALLAQIRRSVDLFHADKPAWRTLMQTGMQHDWSWERSACEYVEVYEQSRRLVADAKRNHEEAAT